MSKSKKTFKYKTPVKSLDMSIVKYLIIVESPSKCTKIESYLGPEYGCIASNGHIRQTGGLKSIDTKNPQIINGAKNLLKIGISMSAVKSILN